MYLGRNEKCIEYNGTVENVHLGETINLQEITTVRIHQAHRISPGVPAQQWKGHLYNPRPERGMFPTKQT